MRQKRNTQRCRIKDKVPTISNLQQPGKRLMKSVEKKNPNQNMWKMATNGEKSLSKSGQASRQSWCTYTTNIRTTQCRDFTNAELETVLKTLKSNRAPALRYGKKKNFNILNSAMIYVIKTI